MRNGHIWSDETQIEVSVQPGDVWRTRVTAPAPRWSEHHDVRRMGNWRPVRMEGKMNAAV